MLSGSLFYFIFCLVSFALAQQCARDCQEECLPRIDRMNQNNWPNWGNGLQNHRNTGDNTINVKNVNKLNLDWMITVHGNVFSTPTIYDGVVYIVDEAGYAYALEEWSGRKLWEVKLGDYVQGTNGRTVWARSAPAVYKDTIIFGIYGPAFVVSLNRFTGALVWSKLLDDHPWALVTMSPTIEKGIVYIGVSSLEEFAAANPLYPCCSFAGSMGALNATTGDIIWKTYMMPLEDAGVGKYAGCSVWGSAPPVDCKNVYIATGNLYALPADVATCVAACEVNPESCIGQPPCVPTNIHFDSVLALDKVTGAIVWSTRLSETDAWTLACLFQSPVNCPIPTGPDFDFGQAPIIFGENSMVIGQKSGVVWGLNRLTGQVRWNTTVDLGGYLGGFMWGGSLAADSYNSLTWIGASANSQFKPTTVNGQTFTGSSIVGINPINGNINWRTEVPLPNNSYGAISSTVEVAFAPAYQSGIMTAYSVKTGEILWSYQTNATLHGGPAISGKRVIFGNGYQAAFGGTPGHNVYCFKLAEYDCDC